MKVNVDYENGVALRVWFECPGCGFDHCLPVRGTGQPGPSWEFDGNVDRPTLAPSILCRWETGVVLDPSAPIVWENVPGSPGAKRDARPRRKVAHVCHSFVRSGRIEFLHDCTHALAGQTVELPEVQP